MCNIRAPIPVRDDTIMIVYSYIAHSTAQVLPPETHRCRQFFYVLPTVLQAIHPLVCNKRGEKKKEYTSGRQGKRTRFTGYKQRLDICTAVLTGHLTMMQYEQSSKQRTATMACVAINGRKKLVVYTPSTHCVHVERRTFCWPYRVPPALT